MDDDLLKRSTDCVYFLASPLTCKKGIDCEYRHSEIARLNPRDCWYWLAGNCFNPVCGFRHPPLDKDTKAPSSLPHECSEATKNNIPCYFYFSGFCSRGERCYFLHGPHGSAPSQKYVKTSPVIANEVLLNDNTCAGNITVSTSEAGILIPSKTALRTAVGADMQPTEHGPKNIIHDNPSTQFCLSQCEDADELETNASLQADILAQRKSQLYIDHILEEPLEDRWESSPGFDVLVDDKSGNLDYEEDQEYLMIIDNEQNELNSHFLRYDFEDPVKYDPVNPVTELQYEEGISDSFNCVDDEIIFEDVRRDSGCSMHGVADSILSQERKLFSAEVGTNNQRDADLREHLRMCRVVEGRSTRRHESSRLPIKDWERPKTYGTRQRMRGISASKVVKHDVGSWGANASLSTAATRRGWRRHLDSSRSRQCRENRHTKRQFYLPERVGKSVARERRYIQASTAFTGPKSLAQIKEEKHKVGENWDCTRKARRSERTASADFEGPKSLSEILKDKRSSGSLCGLT